MSKKTLTKAIENEQYELLTIFKGKNEVTYLLSDWEKYGDNATPIRLRQNTSNQAPVVKFNYLEENTK